MAPEAIIKLVTDVAMAVADEIIRDARESRNDEMIRDRHAARVRRKTIEALHDQEVIRGRG